MMEPIIYVRVGRGGATLSLGGAVAPAKKKIKVQQSSHKNWLAPPLLDILPSHISPTPIIVSGPYSPRLPPLVLGPSYSK